MNLKPKILSFGEIIWDIYETENLIGGAGLNFAAHCSKCGAESYIFSAVGNDELGRKATDIINKLNINTSLLKQSEKATGQCIVKLDSKGTPNFDVLKNTAFDNITVSDSDIAAINKAQFDALYFGTLIQRNHISADSLKKLCQKCSFKEIVCDVNLRKDCYNAESARFCLQNATILKISQEEEPYLKALNLYSAEDDSLESISKAICHKYPQIKYIILTLGENGSFIYCSKTKTYFTENAKKVKVSSTVGAGDSFIAAWISSYISGTSVREATKRAADLSGFVVSKTDAIPEYIFKEGVIYAKCDMHIHSQHSHDSTCPISESAESALKKDISVIAITDHCDIQYYTERDMPGCISGSVKETLETAEQFKGKLKILKGIEIGEGIWNEKYTKEILSSHNFDVIISSVHAVRYKNHTNPYSTIDFSSWSFEEIDRYMNTYFDDVLEMLEKIDCDIMAHLTCPLRYINGKYNKNIDSRKYESKICRILQFIIDNSIALEINTSGIGTPYNNFMPDEWIIKKFRDMGGRLITLGSDAHISANLGNGFDEAIKLLKKYGFTGYYYYENRKSTECKI